MKSYLALLIFFIIIVAVVAIYLFAIDIIFKAHDRWCKKRRRKAPLCKDCQYFDINDFNSDLSECRRPSLPVERNLVSGEMSPYLYFCDACRDSKNSKQCGWKGRFFVKREDVA